MPTSPASSCANRHWDPALWRETPAPARGRGYRVTHCTLCGKFLGYRLKDERAEKEAEHAARVAEYIKK
jgi:hypothetical protein